MKVKRSPKIFNNLPHDYKLDSGDRHEIAKYRDEVETKQRQKSRKQNISLPTLPLDKVSKGSQEVNNLL